MDSTNGGKLRTGNLSVKKTEIGKEMFSAFAERYLVD